MKPTPGRNMMDTDMKWYAIVMIVIIGTPMAGLALDQYQKGQCRIEAIRANMPAEQIQKVCE
jgi:hypothetical protein